MAESIRGQSSHLHSYHNLSEQASLEHEIVQHEAPRSSTLSPCAMLTRYLGTGTTTSCSSTHPYVRTGISFSHY